MRRIRLGLEVALTAITASMFIATAAFAQGGEPQGPDRNGTFSCRASVAQIRQAEDPPNKPSVEPFVANAPGDPCADDDAGIIAGETLPPDSPDSEPHLSLSVASAITDALDDDPATEGTDEGGGHAESQVAFLLLTNGEDTIIAEGLRSQADVRCVDQEPVLTSSSSFVSITILRPGEDPTVVALPPEEGGSNEFSLPPEDGKDTNDAPNDENAIHVNETIEQDTNDDGKVDKRTQRALWLESENGDIIVGEAVADFTGNPCEPPPGTLTIVKETQPDDPQDFAFTGSTGDFQLDDDGTEPAEPVEPTEGDDQLPKERTFVLGPGEHTVTEAEQPGFSLASIECDDEQATEDLSSRTATVTLESDENVRCVFTNAKHGTITVVKNTDPDDPQDFRFTGVEDGDGQFELDDDGTEGELQPETDADEQQPSSVTFSRPPGEYPLTEGEVDGFVLSDIACDDPSDDDGTDEAPDTTEDEASRTATIQLAAGEAVTCTFVNEQRGTVRIVKDTNPDDPQDFAFDSDMDEDGFQLDDDGTEPEGPVEETEGDDQLPSAAEFSVAPGEHTVSEGEAEGFVLRSITCEDPSNDPSDEVADSSGDTQARTATIQLARGETVTCTFLNERPMGTVTIVKDASPDDPQDFAFLSGLTEDGEFQLDDDGENVDGGQETTQDDQLPRARSFHVPPGQFTVTEAEQEGWAVQSVTCEDATQNSTGDAATRSATIDVADQEEVTCTFVNAPVPPPTTGRITIRKDANPDSPQDFGFTSDQLEAFTLDDDSDPALDDKREFGGLADGTYTVTEGAVEGWTLSAIDCTDPTGNSSGDTSARSATIVIDAGETVECTFVNDAVTPTECPAGSTRNGQGACVVQETACPPGSVRNAQGQCIATTVEGDQPIGGQVVAIDTVPGTSPCKGSGFGDLVAIIGTNGRDRITGTNRADRIFAFGGSDRVSGGRGNDCVEGGTGNDNLDGSNGADYLLGGSGRDILNGGTGADRQDGGEGNDKLIGGSGSDRMSGGAGRDRLSGALGNDVMDGGPGRDTLDGGNGRDVMRGGSGDDAINASTSGTGRDTVDCGPGNDTVRINPNDRHRNCERVLVLRNTRRGR